MKALVTGAAGFIGSHLVERLLARGDEVFGVDNFDPFYSRTVKERNLDGAFERESFRFFEDDIRNPAAMSAIVEVAKPDVIVHLAAKAGVRPSIEAPSEYVSTNIQGTLNLLQACKFAPVRHFVFASSSSVYGDTSVVPFTESQDISRPASPYAATKSAGEGLCHTYHRLNSIPITCLRFFTVFGPRQRPDLAIHKFVNLIMSGKPIPYFGDGSTSRDYTFVEDIINGIIAAIDRPRGFEIYNLGHNHPITLAEMVGTLERCLGREARIDRQPEQPGDVRRTYADIARAQEMLGYQPRTSFDLGIKRFVEWWHEMQTWGETEAVSQPTVWMSR